MGILDKRVSEDDIQRVNEVRHRPKYEPGFEEECREERVWYMKGRNGLPVGYFMFEEVQEQFDRWQTMKFKQQNNERSEGNSRQREIGEQRDKWSGRQREMDRCSIKEKKETLFDKITDLLLEYAGIK